MRREADIAFRPVCQGDLAKLDGWLRHEHMRRWWGEPETELDKIRDMLEGRDTTRPFIFLIDGKPVGYIQYWFIGDHQHAPWTDENPWIAELAAETIGVDMMIGDAALLSQGLGSSVLRAFVLRLAGEGYRSIIIDPDPYNGRAVRAYEKAGFRPIADMLGRTGDTLIMQYDLMEDRQAT